jgi:hypothetical protein
VKSFMALLLSCALIAIVSAGAYAQAASISGVVYHAGKHATAWPGLKVYVHGVQGKWIGPSITDGYGRFAFVGLAQQHYLLRVYEGKRLKWQQELNNLGTVPPIILP